MTIETASNYLAKQRSLELLVSHGIQTFLVHGIKDGQCTCGRKDCPKAGKHPIHGNGVYAATLDLEYLQYQLQESPYANIAGGMGKGSDGITLDLDSQKGIDEARALGLPVSWDFATGKGQQIVFEYPELRDDMHVANAVRIGPDMDIRSDGGYCILPPSLHKSGKAYQWLHAPGTVPKAKAPQWLLDKLIYRPMRDLGEREDEQPTELMTEGGRNDYLFRLGCSWRAKGMLADELRLALAERNAKTCNPPLDEDEVAQIVTSISQRYPSGETGSRARVAKEVEEKLGPIQQLPEILLTAPLTDSGNAECLVSLFGKDFRSSRNASQRKTESKGIWRWTGALWVEDTEREFRDRAKWTARGRARIAEQAETKQLRGQIYRHALASENLSKLEAMCELASTDSKLAVPASAWDSDPLRLGLLNGTLNLKTLEFSESDPEDFITVVANVRYDPEAVCPTWEKTVQEIFLDHPELVDYIQRVLGYCLTGLTHEHVMWFWFGTGANGKSTLINTFTALMGGMAAATSFSTFDEKGESERHDALAGLRGKRFVAATEGERGRKLAEAKIKTVVSSDAIRCRFLHNNFFEYKPSYKVILATNHLPELRGTDMGLWRRVHMVPFSQTFEGNKRDKDLELKLRRELPGILNWCLAGLKQYWELGGFDAPPIVQMSVENLRAANDTFQGWVEERLVRTGNLGDSLDSATAFLDYRGYMKSQGELPLTKVAWDFNCRNIGMDFKIHAESRVKTPRALGWKQADQGLV